MGREAAWGNPVYAPAYAAQAVAEHPVEALVFGGMAAAVAAGATGNLPGQHDSEEPTHDGGPYGLARPVNSRERQRVNKQIKKQQQGK
jgi:hypothetical protein